MENEITITHKSVFEWTKDFSFVFHCGDRNGEGNCYNHSDYFDGLKMIPKYFNRLFCEQWYIHNYIFSLKRYIFLKNKALFFWIRLSKGVYLIQLEKKLFEEHWYTLCHKISINSLFIQYCELIQWLIYKVAYEQIAIIYKLLFERFVSFLLY